MSINNVAIFTDFRLQAGSALNLNIHPHMLVLDGAYTFAYDRARFHRAPTPSDAELVRLLDSLSRRITCGSRIANSVLKSGRWTILRPAPPFP